MLVVLEMVLLHMRGICDSNPGWVVTLCAVHCVVDHSFLCQCGWVWVRGFNQQVTRFPVGACGTLACHVIFSILGGGCHHSLIKENKGFGLCFACTAACLFAGSDGIRQRDRTRID